MSVFLWYLREKVMGRFKACWKPVCLLCWMNHIHIWVAELDVFPRDWSTYPRLLLPPLPSAYASSLEISTLNTSSHSRRSPNA